MKLQCCVIGVTFASPSTDVTRRRHLRVLHRGRWGAAESCHLSRQHLSPAWPPSVKGVLWNGAREEERDTRAAGLKSVVTRGQSETNHFLLKVSVLFSIFSLCVVKRSGFMRRPVITETSSGHTLTCQPHFPPVVGMHAAPFSVSTSPSRSSPPSPAC